MHTNLHMAEVRRVAAAQVSASEARFEQLVSVLPVGVCACDAAGRVTFVNRRAVEIWGCEPAADESYEKFSKRFKTFTPDGEPVPQTERPLRLALVEGRTVRQGEAIVERPDGTRFVASFTTAKITDESGGVTGSIAVFQDITGEKRARTALRESEERYRAVFQQASVGIFECELDGRIVRSNPALSRMLGYAPEELVGKNWRELVPAEDLPANDEVAQQLADGRLQAITSERRYRRKDGTTGWSDVFATTILDANGGIARGLAVLVDASERKRAAAELRETEARFRAAADSAPVLIWMTTPDKSCAWVNQPWLDFVGQTLEAVLSEGWTKSVHAEDAERTLHVFDEAFRARQPFSMEYRLRRHDGVYRWVLSHGVPRFQGADFVGYIGSCVDIEDRKRAEAEVARARDEAVAASRAKDDFLAALSH
ncbi:MAG TPA: PAS domain S-box protein, partial [Opitutus sp.]|nr:PAS domain S-box protein [Opitutus sp.]